MSLDFALFDADHHYYEPEDAFTRHLPAGFAKRTMQWATIDGRERLLVAGRINRFIPNPHFDPVARPGSLDAYFRGKQAGDDIREAFGALEPIHPGYRDRNARLAMLDAQGIEACFMFPTLGVGMEEALVADVEAAVDAGTDDSFEALLRYLRGNFVPVAERWEFQIMHRRP